jgi:dihydroorotate dehydrogenase
MDAARLARWERSLRPAMTRLPAPLAVRLYSAGRRAFLKALLKSAPPPVDPPAALRRRLWGIEFRSPLLNAAGVFKNGEGYAVAAAQGAGAYLAGTTTARPREGNARALVRHPFAPYPRSRAASNWLGLPNEGDARVARRMRSLARVPGCPIGASLAADPTMREDASLRALVKSMHDYARAGADFIEINESCPNTVEGTPQQDGLARRLAFVQRRFLHKRSRFVPVIVKFSNDTQPEQVGPLVDLLLDLGFDGVNFGNTSTQYAALQEAIHPRERRLYTHFTRTFGGGVSGAPLKRSSLALCTRAVRRVRSRDVLREFHVIRTGGIEGAKDVRESLRAGIALCEWYTGYFEGFAQHGHDVYRDLYGKLARR